VTLAEESFKIIQEMFEAGQSNLTDLNDAEILLTNQRLRREITMFNIRVTRARVEKLTLRECL
jgi:outer membrane protein TolC